MNGFIVFLICFVSCALCAFVIWFFVTKAKGRCPFCAMKRLFFIRKITIDENLFEDYGVPLDKPIMGWSSWNTFAQKINEDIILDSAEAMVRSGLKDAGYEYINIDDCWQSSLRDINGRLQPDFSAFPSGVDALIEKVNALGLKVGLYTSNGALTCEDLPASLGNEQTDADSLAQWGCEFFKYDFCHHKVDSGVAPLIECMEFSKKGEKPFCVISPDDVHYTGMGRTVSEKRLPSKKAMGFLSHGSGKAVFSVNAPDAGEYILTVCYRKRKVKKAPYLLAKIGEKYFEVLFPLVKGLTPFGRVQAVIELEAGENTIEIGNPIVSFADAAFLQYRRMGLALKKATEGKKPIVYSICEWGMSRPYFWGRKAGNMWRTTPDIRATWSSILHIYSHNIRLWKYANRGHYNDPDMLEVGNGNLSEDENKAHFALWCMMAAPLVLGNDIRKFVGADGAPDTANPTLRIVTDKELIAIDADSLAKPAKRVKYGRADVLARPLENGDIALCFFNKRGGTKKVSFHLARLCDDPYFGLQGASSFTVSALGENTPCTADTVSAEVPKHGVRLYRISPQK
ncbi:MAG: alpha-galactosidase [Clostridia bacterium]|nr:alpha-galactosidase [Clostridia bacterium]